MAFLVHWFCGPETTWGLLKKYSAKVKPHWEAQLTRLQNSLKKKKSVVFNNQWSYAAANAHISNGSTEARCTLVRSALTRLERSERAKSDAKDLLESHQLGKEDELSGKNDPESMEWIRNIESLASVSSPVKSSKSKTLSPVSIN